LNQARRHIRGLAAGAGCVKFGPLLDPPTHASSTART